jgi:tetratricopeptide (TPR) repeat protein
LLLPALGAASSGRGGFAYLLHQEFGIQMFGLKSIPRVIWMLAALPSVVPLIFASFRWPSFEGELSPTGFLLTRVMFSFLHIAFLALVLVTFFDYKYSPNIRFRDQPIDFMTFYYCGALCLGYFSGYMLLVFGEVRLQSWERRTTLQRLLNQLLYGVVWLVALGAPVVLFWQSYPHIRAGHTSVLRQFADQTLASIPATNALLLSDDVARLYLLQADCQRRHIAEDHVLIDTESFPHKEYIGYLISHYPYMRKLMTTNSTALPPVLGPDVLVRFMYQVTQRLPIYYLHPSFGYYFEALYLKPHGLVYEVKPNTNHLERPPLPTAPEVASVDGFWKKLEDGPLKPLPALAKLDLDAAAVSGDYAVALDYWGTDLQKANDLKEAHDAFAEAIRLNPDNVVAAVNLEYNERLLKGNHKPVDSLDNFYAAVVRLGLAQVLRRDGPVDEPGMDLQIGQAMAHYGELGQAAILFQRRLELLPGDPEAQLAMAKTDVDTHQPDKALALIRQLQKTSKLNPWDLARCEALAYMANQHYDEAEKVLGDAVKADPNDENRLETLAEFYLTRGRQLTRERRPLPAGRAFTNALTYVGLQLQLLKSDRLDTVPAYEIPDALLQKAEVEISLDSYDSAVATLTQVMQLQPKNYTALVNRALCEIHIKRYKAARDDFRDLGKLLPEHHYLVEFGLAGVAAAQTNNAEEIAHLKLVIETAPEGTGEYQKATNRLNMLEHK